MPTVQEVLTFLAAITGHGLAFAAFFVIAFKLFLQKGITSLINSYFVKQNEHYRFKLKNTEFIFHYRLDALKELYKIQQRILPNRYFAEMQYDEACEQVALGFEHHKSTLENFLSEYQATLSDEALEKINAALQSSDLGRFDVVDDDRKKQITVTPEATQMADSLMQSLATAIKQLRNELKSMMTIE